MASNDDIFNRPIRKQSVITYGKRSRPITTNSPNASASAEYPEKKHTIALSPPRPFKMVRTADKPTEGTFAESHRSPKRAAGSTTDRALFASEEAFGAGPSREWVTTAAPPSSLDALVATDASPAFKRRRVDPAAERQTSELSELTDTDSESDGNGVIAQELLQDQPHASQKPKVKLNASATFTLPEPPRTPPRHVTELPQPPSTGLRTPPRSLAAVRNVSPSPRRGPSGFDFGQDVPLTPKFRARRRMLTRHESLGKTKSVDDAGMEAPGSSGRDLKNGNTISGSSTSGLIFGAELGAVTPTKSSAPGTPQSGRGGSSAAGSPARLAKSRSMPESPSRGLLSRPGVKTYGGTRSYLQQVEMPLPVASGDVDIQRVQETLASHVVSKQNWEQDDVLKQLGARAVPKIRESYTDLKKKYAMSNDGVDADGGEDSQESYKLPPTVSDLRSKGENRAFMDELGYILDGFKAKSKAVARSSALDLLNQSLDVAWLGRLKICGQIEVVYRTLIAAKDGSPDQTLDLAILLYLVLVLNLGSLDVILEQHMEECLEFLVQECVVASLPGKGVGRSSKYLSCYTSNALLDVYRKVVPESADNPSPESALSVKLLSTVLNGDFAAGVDLEALVQHMGLLSNIASNLAISIAGFADRLDMREKGLDLFPEATPDLPFLSKTMDLLYNIVEHYLPSREILEQDHQDLASSLVDFANIVWVLHAEDLTSTIALDLWMNILRLLSHMTRRESAWINEICNHKGTPTVIMRLLQRERESSQQSGCQEKRDVDETASSQSASSFDVSCLALGVLSNLIDFGNFKRTFLATELRADCESSSGCVNQCRCANRGTALENLAPLFDWYFDNHDDPSSAFLSGYMALLFCKLMKDDRDTQQTKLLIVGSQSRHQNLVTALEEFQDVVENARQKIAEQEATEVVGVILPSRPDDRSSGRKSQADETEIRLGLRLLRSM